LMVDGWWSGVLRVQSSAGQEQNSRPGTPDPEPRTLNPEP
jgi:hypothetical protein